MSTINTVIKKLNDLRFEVLDGDSIPVEDLDQLCLGYVAGQLEEILSLLTDETVLLLEWNEIDIQKVAREKLANMENCEEEDIIEKPLSRAQVIEVLEHLDNYYDCNYGITWEKINSALDIITLPDSDSCRIVKLTPENVLKFLFAERRQAEVVLHVCGCEVSKGQCAQSRIHLIEKIIKQFPELTAEVNNVGTKTD
jgi:hypothetical protein